MTRPHRLLALGTLLLLGAPAAAVDYTKIDRTIAKEPKYQGQPQYCLVVFGADADTRVWLVLDGDHLYADQNANGDLTDPSERCSCVMSTADNVTPRPEDNLRFEPTISTADGKRKYELGITVVRANTSKLGNRQAFKLSG